MITTLIDHEFVLINGGHLYQVHRMDDLKAEVEMKYFRASICHPISKNTREDQKLTIVKHMT